MNQLCSVLRKVVLAAAISGVLASSAIAYSADDASAYAEPVWHWNIYGTCADDGNCGNGEVITILNFLVNGSPNRPWLITLNEVCGQQFMQAAAFLHDLGYTEQWAKTSGNKPPGPIFADAPVNCNLGEGNGAFGNAIFMLGSLSSRPPDYYYTGANTQTAGGDTRVFSCMIMNTVLGARSGCTTHLDKTGSFTAPGLITINQDNIAAYLATAAANSGQKVIVGADRNYTDKGSWTSFQDIDTASPKLRTHSIPTLTRKIDWILGGPGHGGIAGTSRYCPPYRPGQRQISDHCMLFGSFNI